MTVELDKPQDAAEIPLAVLPSLEAELTAPMILTVEQQCLRCGYKWIPRRLSARADGLPLCCALCHSHRWQHPPPRPRIHKTVKEAKRAIDNKNKKYNSASREERRRMAKVRALRTLIAQMGIKEVAAEVERAQVLGGHIERPERATLTTVIPPPPGMRGL